MVHELVRSSGNISVHVIAGEHLAAEPIPKKTIRAAEEVRSFDAIPYVASIIAVAVALGIDELIKPIVGIENVDLVFMTAIVAVAVRYGLLPSLFASVVASLCYNFFFLPPIYTFTITDPTNVAAFLIFIVMAVLVSNVAARVRTQAMAAIERARTTEALYAFSRKLAGVGTLDDVLWATAYQTALMLKVRVVLLLPENGSIAVRAGYPPEDLLDDADLAAARWAWEHNRAAGRGSDTLPGAKRLFLPMRTGRGAIGIVGIDSDKPGPLLTPDQRRQLDALIDQGALAIERVLLVEDVDRAKRSMEADRLRSALLTSISHDLKTPLAAILGAAGTMRQLSGALDDASKAELLATIIDKSERLNRFIANLLDITRLESGAIVPQTTLQDLGELVGSALARAAKILTHHRVDVELAADVPMLELDPVLFEQVLFNLLDNASKYAPADTTIRIRTGAKPSRSACRCWMKASASRLMTSSGFLTSSIARRRATRCALAPASGLRSRAASWKRSRAPSRRRTAPTAPARCSPFGCQFRRRARNWIPPHECARAACADRRRRTPDPQAVAHGARHPRV